MNMKNITMNIYAKKGDRVIYKGDAKANPKDNRPDVDNAIKYLKKGEIYTVKRTMPKEWITFVELEEFKGIIFNTVHFKDCIN